MGEHGLQPRARGFVRNKNHRDRKNRKETITTELGVLVSSWISGHQPGRAEEAKYSTDSGREWRINVVLRGPEISSTMPLGLGVKGMKLVRLVENYLLSS